MITGVVANFGRPLGGASSTLVWLQTKLVDRLTWNLSVDGLRHYASQLNDKID